MTTQRQYLNLDALLEGIQIIDYNWRYAYLNEKAVKQARMPKAEMIGFTIMEKNPGIEQTEFFSMLQQTMADRKPRQFKNEFVCPDQTVEWFEISIEPDEQGICILSLDITKHKEYEEKLNKAKDLYSFLSQINQSIVRLKSEKDLFKDACQIAVKFGKFKTAWIGIFDEDYQNISLVEQCGVSEAEIPYFTNAALSESSPMKHVIETNSYFVCNDSQNLEHEILRAYALANDIYSFIILPLHKKGKIIGTFNFYSDKIGFSGPEEIKLLEEVTSDISFALDNFEKEKKHRETERLVLENEKRFRALIEKSADMKTLADHEGKLFYGSPSVSKKLGYDLEAMKFTSVFDFIHPDDLPKFVAIRKQLSSNPGASTEFEMRMRHANGHYIWIEGSITNMLEESGVHALVSNFRDITDKKHIEQQMEFERNNTIALINNTHDLMWSIDKELRLITSNRAFDEMVMAVYGKKIHPGDRLLEEPLSAENREQYSRFYQRALSGESFSEVIQVVLPDGNWAEISFQPIVKGDEIIGIACHSHDITKRMLSEERLETQNSELIKINFELDRFVYSVSHDLRSPLTSILGLLSIVEEDTRETATKLHIELIRGRINRLDDFIRYILQYSRNKRTPPEMEKIDLKTIIGEVIKSLNGLKEMSGIRFEINVAGPFPFWSDRQSILTILENILTNAIKFHHPNQREKYIRIDAKINQDKLLLTISDNGLGIAPNQIDRIFDMFYRASAKVEGTGLGLYIVREIVEKLQGSVWATSTENKGATFHISLKNMQP